MDELIQNAPLQNNPHVEHGDTDDRYNLMFTREYMQWEADTWQYCLTQEDHLRNEEMIFLLGDAATRMIEWVYGEKDQREMVCHACSKVKKHCVLNGPKQFIEHCVGRKHCKSMKSLKREAETYQ